ncbi:MAG TPA: tetratricopeptide repeat protein [Xanthomonadales bacterium]|nr:tetratricopeptide repeat protein [Xanthomonadales bacterium]
MKKDPQGHALTGANTEALALYDQAITAFNNYRGDPMGLLDQATALAPEFAMAFIAKACLFVSTSEPAALLEAATLLATVKGMKLNDRERSLAGAIELASTGAWMDSALALDYHSLRYPLDLLALQIGHLIDFLCANARNLRDRIARALPAWTSGTPAYSNLLGMYAFGLEECGDYARAEDSGRRALDAEPYDSWAHHAVTHVMEMQGRAEEGIDWMEKREPWWGTDDNFFKVHNWWHKALFHLDMDQKKQALAIYDGPVRKQHSPNAMDLVDASALLWRLQMSGCDVGQRWQEVADGWLPHADGRSYPFNDWHAAMALLGAKRQDELDDLRLRLRKTRAAGGDAGRWAGQFGLPLVDGFAAFARAEYSKAIELLYPVRNIVNGFGGSHAQRDIIDWTVAEAAVRAGDTQVAAGLVNERLAHKPSSAVNWSFLSRLHKPACRSATP